MPEWQERITRETRPALRVEHELRYAAAAALIRGASAWVDLGCGDGVATVAALGDERPARALLVDSAAGALEQAARMIPSAELLEADLATAAGHDAVRTALGDARGGVATCFELIAQLERFAGLVELLVELAAERRFTVVLSVPNDAFWPLESPWHATTWGEGSFEELRRLLPADHVVAHQIPLQGSAIAPVRDAPAGPPPIAARDDAVPSHFLAAFGPRCRELGARSAVVQADLAEERRWVRQREASLALYEDRLQLRP